MTDTATLVAQLRKHAARRGALAACTFLDDAGEEAASLTYAGLDREARAIAARLAGAAEPGDRALLLYPPGLGFVTGFLGCLYAGVIAVPAYPPRSREGLARVRSIVADASPRLALTTAGPAGSVDRLRSLFAGAPDLAGLPVLATDCGGCEGAAAAAAAAADYRDPGVAPGDIAFLQYTSGSTAAPKGVAVSHANLLHNQAMIGEAFGTCEESVVVGWLPLYHDMGLIGNVLHPLFLGARTVLMAPAAFLLRPRRWLAALSRYGATVSGGPNFAYDLAVRKIPPAERGGLDLSRWQVAFNGAEPVRAETLERFAAAFAPCGFSPDAFYPCYGLAEATLFVAGGRPGLPPRVRAAGAATPEGAARRLVGCGEAWGGQEIAIVDRERGVALPAGAVGEIWVGGASVAGGYWNRPQESAAVFGARLPGRDGTYLRTGDLGFWDGEALFVTGRAKDLIILRGRNHYPQDLELAAEGSHPAVRPGHVAAFALDSGGDGDADGGERLVVVAELERRREAEAGEALAAVRRALAEEQEVAAHDIVLVRLGGVPMTSSGKVRRAACRQAYLDAALPVLARSLAAPAAEGDGEDGDGAEPAAGLSRQALLALPEGERPAALAAELSRLAARRLGVSTELAARAPWLELGLDSLGAVEISHRIEEALGVAPPLESLLGGEGAAAIAGRLLAALARGEGAAGATDTVAPELGEHPASYGQRSLWVLEGVAPGAHNVAAAARVRAGLDTPAVAALAGALAALAARHPALRTTLAAGEDGSVRQVVHAVLPPDFAAVAAASWEPARIDRFLAEEAYRPFDLARGPLLRVRVLELAGGEALLLWAIHHAVTDFWSMALLARELTALYGHGPDALDAIDALPRPALHYGDFARRQEARLSGEEGERMWSYWRGALAGELPVLELPTDRPRPALQTYRGGSRTLLLSPAASAAVRRLARQEGATLHATLLAAWATLLGRWSGQREAVVGTPAAGRVAGTAEVVGYFVNLLPLRLDVAGEPTFTARLAGVREAALAGLTHQDFPFALLVERLLARRDPSRPPLFSAAFVLEQSNRPGEEALAAWTLGEAGVPVELGALALVTHPLPEVRARFELTLAAAERAGVLGLALEHNADLFEGVTATRLLAHFACLLESAAADPDRACEDLPLLPAAERHQLLTEWTDCGGWGAEFGGEDTLPGLFAAQVARTPDAVAVVAGEERLSYAELERRAGCLAGRLRRLGVGPEVTVGLFAGRDAGLVVGLWGILMAGGAYVPLDAGWPRARRALVLADSGAGVVVVDREKGDWAADWSGVVLAIDGSDGLDRSVGSDGSVGGNLSYLIYTSGSTGKPKGVAIEQRSAVALASWVGRTFSAVELGGVLASTSIAFDMSVFELVLTLVQGGRAILVGNVLELGGLPARAEVTLVNTVPSALAALLQADGLPPGLLTANLGGEALPASLVRDLEGRGISRILNLYGPSEDTTYSTWAVVTGAEPVPIGRPVDGTRAYLLSAAGTPVPAGAVGHLHLAGAGLARGYLGQPERTAERFLPDPFGGAGERLYQTGDLARHRADATLDYLGRLDSQVKVRGFRIEPAEVEARLLAEPGVREAAVLSRPAAGGAELVAFVVLAGGSPSPARLRQAVAASLPAYMVPAAVVVLDALPRNANGKLDRRALSTWTAAPEGGRAAAALPGGPVEEIVAGILAEVLERDRVAPDDDFFALGGHSLLAAVAAARVREALGVELPLSRVFELPTAAGLAAAVEAALRAGLPPAEAPRPRQEEGDAPLTSGQERLWFLERLRPGAVYNMPMAARLSGPVAPAALAAALRELARRHEALRTTFPETAGAPAQRVGAAGVTDLPLVDLRGLIGSGGIAHRDAEAARLASGEARRPFDLAAGPLARTLLLRLAGEEHHLVLVLHHIVADGRSLEILLAELAPLYAAALAGAPSPLPDPPLQLADVAAWERRRLAGTGLAASLAYWEGRLAGAAPLELPADRPRPPAQTPAGGRRSLGLPAPLAEAVAALARGERATPFLVLVSLFAAQLHRYTGQRDLTVGSPVAGRGSAGLPEVVGFLVNTVGLRLEVERGLSLRGLVVRARTAAVEAQAHGDLPFEKVVERLQPARALSHNPLFQVMFTLEPAVGPLALAAGVELLPRAVETGTAKLDLALTAAWGADRLALTLEYAADLFDAATADRMLGHFATLLAAGVEDPARAVGGLPLLSPAERWQVLGEWNQTAEPVSWLPVHEEVAAWAKRQPDAPAVIEDGAGLTFGELAAAAGRIGRVLRDLGLAREEVVPILARRSPALVASALGVLVAGGAYAPLDPASPPARLEAMLREVKARLVLAEDGLAHLLPGFCRAVLIDGPEVSAAAPLAARAAAKVEPGQLAYLIFTSGSTGVPKVVAACHGALANIAAWTRRHYGIGPGDRATQMSGPAFDAAVWEIWSFITGGAGLFRPCEEVRLTPSRLVAWMAAERLTVAYLPTPLVEIVLTEPWPAGAPLRLLITGGDRLRRRPGPGHPFALANLYGPSEATVLNTFADVAPEAPGSRPPTLGRPIANVRVTMLDAGLEAVPAGVPGELCVGGDGLARGYFGRPDLTAERYVPDPFRGVPGARLYRTGDLARWLPGGEIEFLGRLDHQLKIRGLRIEIGEIEAALAAHPGVREAVVALRRDPRGEPRLVAWVAGRPAPPTPGELRPFLAALLPAYMIPSAVVPVEELPLTLNGKVDRAALAEPDWEHPELSGGYAAPRTAVETLLAGIWSELLGASRVGIHDNFFELGGQSLKAARLMTRLHETFGVELPVATVFESPTVAAMSKALAIRLLQRADPRTRSAARAGVEPKSP